MTLVTAISPESLFSISIFGRILVQRNHALCCVQLYNCSSTETRQPKVSKFFSSKQPCSPERAKIITELVAKVIVGDLHPIAMVDGTNFQNLIKFLEPGYVVPSRPQITKVIEQQHESLQTRIKSELISVEFVCLTTDAWTSTAMEAYLGVTAHYMKGWELKNCALAVKPLEDRHTGKNVAEWLESVWNDFGIPPHRIVAIAHDNGSNIVNAIELLKFKYAWIQSIRCAGHTLQLCLSEINKDQQISSAINSVRKAVKFFKHSELASTALAKKQEQMGIPVKSLIHDVPTRWNSTQQMIDRILEQRWAVMAVFQDLKKPIGICPSEWDLL